MHVEPDTVVYLCICIRSDCHAAAFGPFWTREAAQEECWVKCDYAHLVHKTTFRGSLEALLHCGATQDADNPLYRAWLSAYLKGPRNRLGSGGYPTENEKLWEAFMETCK